MAGQWEGKTLGQFRIERLIGSGSIGEVYQAHDRQADRVAAVKVIYPHLAENAAFRRQFLVDVQAQTRLQHPNVVPVYAVSEMNQVLYMGMAFARGGSLEDYLQHHRKDNKLPPIYEALSFAKQAADGLHYVHDQNIIHRDLKPSNILLLQSPDSDKEEAALSDLGLKELSRSAISSGNFLEKESLPFLAPEVIFGSPGDVEADMYSLGAILYLLVVGRTPFAPNNIPEARRIHETRQPIVPPTRARAGVPAKLEQIIYKCLAKDPAERYATGQQLSRELLELIDQLVHQLPTTINPARPQEVSTVMVVDTYIHPDTTYTQPQVAPHEVGQDRLIIAGGDRPTRAMLVEQETLLVGRDEKANIVLDSPKVSRFHVRLEKRPNGTYQVTDLGSMNGTYMGNSQRLVPNESFNWEPGTFLRVGDFRLVLEPAESLDVTMRAVLPDKPLTYEEPLKRTQKQEPLDITARLDPDDIVVVTPGETQSVRLNLSNQSNIVDHFTISIRGIPPEWVTLPTRPVEMLENTQTAIPINFSPPIESASTAGIHTFDIIIRGEQPQNLPKVIPGRLQIQPFYRYQSDLHPTVIRQGNTTHVSITNDGNSPQKYKITARDREDTLNFLIEHPVIEVGPGRSEKILITFSQRHRQLLGSVERVTFEVMVTNMQNIKDSETHNGDITVSPWLTRQNLFLVVLVFGLCALLTFCSFLGIFTLNQQRAQQRADNRNATIVRETQIFTQNMTATADSDIDGDGLTFQQERQLGTDPNREDTDGDGLTDRQEIQQFDTNPTLFDTDRDTISDGEEVNLGCNNPRNPDTDGDGLRDNIDPDPCRQPTPTVEVPPPAALPPTVQPNPSG